MLCPDSGAEIPPTMLRTKTLRAALLLPAALAVSFLTSVGSAKADSTLDAQIAAYANDEGNTKTVTAATAQANDLVYAVYTVLFNNPNLTDTQVAQIAADALTTTAGKTRADRNAIVGRIVSAAIYGSRAEDNPARIKAILDKVASVNANTKSALNLNGKAVAIASALKVAADSGSILPTDFTSTSLNAGAAIAASANGLGLGLPLQTAVAHALATGIGTSNLPAYYNAVLDALPGDKTANALTIAAAAGSQPTVAGGVIAGAAADLTQFGAVPNDGAVKTLVATAAKNGKLKKSINGIVAGGFSFLSPAALRGSAAADLINGNAKLKASAGLIAAGALQARGTVSTETTGSVLQAILTAAGTVNAKLAAFAGQAALGNGASADEVVTFIASKVPDAKSVTAVASAVIKSIAFEDTASIADAAAAAATSGAGGTFPDASKGALAAALAKAAAKSYTAAGAAVAGVVRTTADQANSAVSISAAAIKTNTKAATGIAEQVAELLGTSAAIDTYANALAKQVSPSFVGGVLGGVALADPNNTAKLVTEVLNAGATSVKAQTLKIASTVAGAVDIERVCEVGKAVGALLGQAGFPKVTSFASLATALTKAINAKPLRSPNDPLTANAGWHNRVDEIGELAATLINAALASPAGKDAKVLASIGTAIYKGVSKRLLANAGNNLADLKDVAQDVAGAIFQTISISSGLTSAEKTALLDNAGALQAALTKGAGKTFGSLVGTALAEVKAANGGLVAGSEPLSNGGTGKYEVGCIVDPETPAKNI